jgi:hypothetical protein
MKNTLRYLAYLFIYLIIYAELTACSTQPAIINSISQRAENIDIPWKKGKEQVTQGEKLVESGMQLMDESLRNSAD